MRVVRAADAVAMPWRNGGGVTREYLVQPSDEGYDWRLSVAEVATNGPFSEFAGFDRILVLLSGAGMVLRFADAPDVTLSEPLQHHRFAGEAVVNAALVSGPTTDLNLFWRRDAWDADMQVVEAPCDVWNDGVPGRGVCLTYVVEGEVSVDGTQLRWGDMVQCDHPFRLMGRGRAVVFSLTTAACR